MWSVSPPDVLEKALSSSIFGYWEALKERIEGSFLSRVTISGKEEWYLTSLSEEDIRNMLKSSFLKDVAQIGIFIGERDEKSNDFSLSVGGLLALAPCFHPIAIARHENRFLSGNTTTADNSDMLRNLDETKSMAVSSRHGVLLGLACVKSISGSNDVFLEPLWTIRTTFQQEWRRKRAGKY